MGAGIESTESKAANIYRRGNIFKVYRFIIFRRNNILENTFLFDISIRMDCSARCKWYCYSRIFFLNEVSWKDHLKIDNFLFYLSFTNQTINGSSETNWDCNESQRPYFEIKKSSTPVIVAGIGIRWYFHSNREKSLNQQKSFEMTEA